MGDQIHFLCEWEDSDGGNFHKILPFRSAWDSKGFQRLVLIYLEQNLANAAVAPYSQDFISKYKSTMSTIPTIHQLTQLTESLISHRNFLNILVTRHGLRNGMVSNWMVLLYTCPVIWQSTNIY